MGDSRVFAAIEGDSLSSRTGFGRYELIISSRADCGQNSADDYEQTDCRQTERAVLFHAE